MLVHRRRVIFVPGYDPRGTEHYFRTLRSELQKFDGLYKWRSTLDRLDQKLSSPVASCTINTTTDVWTTTTNYDFLQWDDLIKHDFRQPLWRTMGYALFVLGAIIKSGGLRRIAMANWRFACFLLYPFGLLFFFSGVAFTIGYFLNKGLMQADLPHWMMAILVFVVFALVLSAQLKWLAGPTHMFYVMSLLRFSFQFSSEKLIEWDERINTFANYLTEVCKTDDAEEILIVGHSTGSFLAIEIVARALLIDPQLAQRVRAFSLLAVGAVLPLVGYVTAAKRFRESLRRVAFDRNLDWVDCQSRIDVINFFSYDPIAGHRLDDGSDRRNPLVVAVRFRESMMDKNFFRFRWDFFRVHFQFIRANEKVALYDFFMILMGPVSLRKRFEDPDVAIAILHSDRRVKLEALRKICETGP